MAHDPPTASDPSSGGVLAISSRGTNRGARGTVVRACARPRRAEADRPWRGGRVCGCGAAQERPAAWPTEAAAADDHADAGGAEALGEVAAPAGSTTAQAVASRAVASQAVASDRGAEPGTLRDAEGGGSGIECGWLDRPCGGPDRDSCRRRDLAVAHGERLATPIPGPCGAGGAEGDGGSKNGDRRRGLTMRLPAWNLAVRQRRRSGGRFRWPTASAGGAHEALRLYLG